MDHCARLIANVGNRLQSTAALIARGASLNRFKLSPRRMVEKINNGYGSTATVFAVPVGKVDPTGYAS
jgi:hypothetical protein